MKNSRVKKQIEGRSRIECHAPFHPPPSFENRDEFFRIFLLRKKLAISLIDACDFRPIDLFIFLLN